jgi:phosphoglycolate phosphatase
MQLITPMACLVCGDDAPLPKPAPDTLLMACEQSLVKPECCFYVGDAERDIEAGNAASMKTVVALWGYIDTTDKPMKWGADFEINHPLELIALINESF